MQVCVDILHVAQWGQVTRICRQSSLRQCSRPRTPHGWQLSPQSGPSPSIGPSPDRLHREQPPAPSACLPGRRGTARPAGSQCHLPALPRPTEEADAAGHTTWTAGPSPLLPLRPPGAQDPTARPSGVQARHERPAPDSPTTAGRGGFGRRGPSFPPGLSSQRRRPLLAAALHSDTRRRRSAKRPTRASDGTVCPAAPPTGPRAAARRRQGV